MRILAAGIRSTHPGPTFAVTLVAVLLAVGVGLEPWRTVLVAVVVLGNQFCIGLVNDLVDAPTDRASGRTDKPIAAGALPEHAAIGAAVISAIVSLGVAAALGPRVLVADAVLLAAGVGYDLGLKRMPPSVLAYLVGFAAMPAIPVLALTGGEPAWWAMAAGSALGGAAHFGNALPDLEVDRRYGVRGTPQLLGRTRSVIVCFAFLVLGAVLLMVGLEGSPLSLVIGGVTLGIGAAGILLGLRGVATRWLFRLVIAAAVLDTALLIAAGPAVAGG